MDASKERSRHFDRFGVSLLLIESGVTLPASAYPERSKAPSVARPSSLPMRNEGFRFGEAGMAA